ncbi:amidophosphoribosyltransferase [SAR202 cluster bacterium AD-804-J14_MRT_500m]|nr:amidophosphoribosyltransferase [SAR202 cluster bacterium AD-804-J14_MRT_500m]
MVAAYTPGDHAARVVFFGLFALQHRGQESAGIAASNGQRISVHTGMGLVTQAFGADTLVPLDGEMAIGHTRYSTTGSSTLANAQPFKVQSTNGDLALAHNGNIINAVELRKELKKSWSCEFNSTTDSEVLAQIIAKASGQTWQDQIGQCMRQVRGAFSAVVQTKDAIIGIKDPLGVRPLCLGRLDRGWVIASESCALDHVGAVFERELEPGEAVRIDKHGIESYLWPGRDGRRAMCVFEQIYFARPDSLIDKRQVHGRRVAMGAKLAEENPACADLVIGIPDSATAAAMGYAQASGLPYSDGLVKNRYVGRTFIEPDQRLRSLDVQLKFNPLSEVISGKKIVVVDDSIVRGTTTPRVVGLLRKAGATEIHMRICAPPIMWPCHFGVDMATRRELIAANYSVDEIREKIGVDTLGYLSVEGLMEVVTDGGDGDDGFCNACFTGTYPIPVQLEMDKLILERQEI